MAIRTRSTRKESKLKYNFSSAWGIIVHESANAILICHWLYWKIGDIHVHIDRETNTLLLQHSYLLDSSEMLTVCLESEEIVSKDVRGRAIVTHVSLAGGDQA